MSDLSARLALPFILPAQAQKHVTHNEALERLDMVVQLTVEAFGAESPPALPEDGQIWALGQNPSGAWADEGGMLAAWNENAWVFVSPRQGWIATQGNLLRIWEGSQWAEPDLPAFQNLDGLGVNTTFDGINRLAVSSDATLLTHDGQGHQLKLNKNDSTDTASLLFQTGWMGHAELGTAGDDDFAIKVSADGTTWHDGLVLDRSSGKADLPNGATISGTEAYRRGNILGAVTQTGGTPTGAIIQRGSNNNGDFVRYADGTQFCYATLNLGNATDYGNGTFDNLFRTNIQNWSYPAAFIEPPLISGSGTIASTVGNARRMVLSFRFVTETQTDAIQAFRVGANNESADCTAYMVAIGRWY